MSRSIMIIEDDIELRKICRHALEKVGYEVIDTSDGAWALEQMKHTMPDAILLDLLMPHVNGQMILDELDNYPNRDQVKIILLTAHPNYRAKISTDQIDLFLTKPVQVGELRDKVRELLGD